MSITFERTALYEAVWKSPLTSLAAQYGLSDNGLRKICKALDIPLPSVGHWARVAAGHRVVIPPLPPSSGRTRFISEPPPQLDGYSAPEDDEWLNERLAFDAMSGHRCTFDPTPSRWHKAVKPLRSANHEALKVTERWRRSYDRHKKSGRQWADPGYEGGRWTRFDDKGQVLVDTHKPYPVRVTPTTSERALAVLNAVCWAAEDRGFAVTLDEEQGRIALAGHGATVQLRMSEHLVNGTRKEINSWSKKPEVVKTKTPSGLLRLYVGWSWREKAVGDSKDHPLEQKLMDVLEAIYGAVIRARQDAREQDARKRMWEEEAERRAMLAEQARLDHEAKEAERRKRDALVSEARAWETAELIRRYVTHVRDAGIPGDDSEWAKWALKVARDLERR